MEIHFEKSMHPISHMRREALQSASVVAELLQQDDATLNTLTAYLQRRAPPHIVTIARGSSDHAAAFFAYLCMLRMGRYVTSVPPSLLSLHQAPLQRSGTLALAFSQSGRSPDLVAATAYFSGPDSHSVALVNDAASPLAQQAQTVLPLHAGTEVSVAATKSFIAQLVAGARLLAVWQGDTTLQTALAQLPTSLEVAAQQDWGEAVQAFSTVDRLMVVSRGTGMAVALEAALKFKETCGIQAETFSCAELRHGPMALIDQGYPLLILAPRGPAQAEMRALAAEMRARGARVLLAACGDPQRDELPATTAAHPDLDPVCLIQSFYLMVEALSRNRGRNPDQPSFLSKVTLTN
jgi:glucosamine--fructose-6-phosphate aminotransferase (isomerizing)